MIVDLEFGELWGIWGYGWIWGVPWGYPNSWLAFVGGNLEMDDWEYPHLWKLPYDYSSWVNKPAYN